VKRKYELTSHFFGHLKLESRSGTRNTARQGSKESEKFHTSSMGWKLGALFFKITTHLDGHNSKLEKNGKDYNGCSGHSGSNTHC